MAEDIEDYLNTKIAESEDYIKQYVDSGAVIPGQTSLQERYVAELCVRDMLKDVLYDIKLGQAYPPVTPEMLDGIKKVLEAFWEQDHHGSSHACALPGVVTGSPLTVEVAADLIVMILKGMR